MDTFMNSAGLIVKNFVFQLIFTIGLITVIGLIVGLVSKAFYSLAGDKFGRITCMATGFIGVPIHEIGHAVFCLIFRHRITEIKMYQPNSADGTLGYVNHTYNSNSLYQQIGNFFIGFGPILFGSVVLLLLMFFLVPNLYEVFKTSSDFSGIVTRDFFTLSALKSIYEKTRGVFAAFYSASAPGDWKWWVFMILACSIALQMSLSVPDIKSSWAGFGFIVVTLLIANTILYIVKIDMMFKLTSYCLRAGAFILNFLAISVVFSLLLLLIGVVLMIIRILREAHTKVTDTFLKKDV